MRLHSESVASWAYVRPCVETKEGREERGKGMWRKGRAEEGRSRFNTVAIITVTLSPKSALSGWVTDRSTWGLDLCPSIYWAWEYTRLVAKW